MKNWTNLLSSVYYKVINSIAFYPTLITIVFLGFSLIVMNIEYNEVVIEFKNSIERVLVHDANNARLILGTIVGSIISLMVFSFSMVMIVLNSATSTLSPRVIPGLVSDKFHQIVLGFYLGSIIFSLILIVNIDAPTVDFSVPSLGIFLSMLLTIVCLALFVYFIHSISQKIQVGYILNEIYNNTKRELEKVHNEDAKIESPNTETWNKLAANKTGYLKKISKRGIHQYCVEHDIRVKIDVPIGFFVVQGYPFLKVEQDLDEKTLDGLRTFFVMYQEERVTDHYSFGFKQISEIAVKALSPGINDPGTALKAIDFLSDLFATMVKVDELNYVRTDSDEQNPRVFINPLSLEQLMNQVLIPIKEYGKNDISVILSLLNCFKYMLIVDKDQHRFTKLITKFIHNIVLSSKTHIESRQEKEILKKAIDAINILLDSKNQIDLI